MEYPVSVFLFGGEGTGWALDADVETTRQSLQAIPEHVRLTSLKDATVIHSVWEFPLLHMDPALLDGKRIVCHICNDLMRTYEDPSMIAVGETLGLWVAISKTAQSEIRQLGYKADYIPYSVDTQIFTSNISEQSIESLRSEHQLPRDVFIISSFMRDSSSTDLQKPKEQKGVELFVAIVKSLQQKQLPIHVLLAGPRRHWLREKLKEIRVPYTYIGQEIDDDDNQVNILSPESINDLYHISDLHLVTSRWEGGPRAVLEASATMTPILCTPVGMAPDILEPDCLIDSVDDAVEKIERLIVEGKKSYPLNSHYECVMSSHTPKANIERFRKLYKDIESVPVFTHKSIRWERTRNTCVPFKQTYIRRLLNFVDSVLVKKKNVDLTIGLWHEFHKPPYGGGNQFMLALRKEFEHLGVNVVVNKVRSDVDVYICNSAWFDTKIFEQKSSSKPIKMIHRIDGPITLYRGEGRQEDDKIFQINKRFASATVFQSAFSFKESCNLGYSSVSPVIIHNAVDREIFNAKGRIKYDSNRKISLISTSWSDNPRKGGPFYKWLDENLDFNRFEYTFVGRVKQEFENIKHIPSQGSEELAELLRKHDIYITASLHEPCSNALLEALSCGLPALYRNGGGSSELVEFGGLPFDGEDDFLSKLERLVGFYESFQSSIYIKSMRDIATRYYELAQKIVHYQNIREPL